MRKELKYGYKQWPLKKGISAEKIPHYAKKAGEWRFNIGEHEVRGELELVMGEFAGYNEIYRYHLHAEETAQEAAGWEDHQHEFNCLLSTLLCMPEHFSVEGYEEDYSPQQIALIKAVREKLLVMGKKNEY